MLRDAGDLTLEMSSSSRKRREGWVFSQAYNSYKELFDAAKIKPFKSPYLTQLSWDSLVTKMITIQGKRYTVPNKQLRGNYQGAKHRFYESLLDGNKISYGVREEHRISLTFFGRMRASLESSGTWDQSQSLIADDSLHIQALHTHDYLQYLLLNANKFMAAAEWILSYQQRGRISYEHCKIITLFLQALPFTFDSGPIMRQNELWKDKFERRKGGPQVLGMGLRDSLSKFGYMWFPGRIDWQQMVFQERFANQIGFANSMLREKYRANWLNVKTAKDDLSRLETAGRWLALYHTNIECRSFILQFMIQLIMRSYRIEVFYHLKKDINNIKLYKKAINRNIYLY